MLKKLRTAGWTLLALGVVVLVVVVVVGSFRAHGTDQFNRWVGWATIAAVPIAALGVLFLIWEKIKGSNRDQEGSTVIHYPETNKSEALKPDETQREANARSTELVYPGARQWNIQSGWREYMQQVRDIAPREGLIDRDAELVLMEKFCTGKDTYWWWRGDAWTGKSALMSWFVLHPPPGVIPVSFFITARYVSQDDSNAFVAAVLGQLQELSGDLQAVSESTDPYRRLLLLLNETARLFEAREQQLILVVDGLDEDASVEAGLPSIASLLPKQGEAGLKIIVASRPNPLIPADVAADHPLRNRSYAHALSRSEHAQVIRDAAELELRSLLVGSQSHRDLLGLVTSAGGGLTRKDLGELTGLAPFEISDALRGVTGRTFTTRSNAWSAPGDESSKVYLLAHETLQIQAIESFGEEQLSDYRNRLIAWADSYQEAAWPPHTPIYLLQGYFRMLRASGNASKLIDCSMDSARHDRMLNVSGGDASAMTEISIAQNVILNQENIDLASMARLARHRDDVTIRNHDIPSFLPTIWVLLNIPDRAENLARSMTDPAEKSRALADVARALARAGWLQRADEVARSVNDPVMRATSLAIVVRASAAAGLRQWALAASLAAETSAGMATDPAQRAHAMKALAEALARSGFYEKAERVALAVEAPARRAEALAVLAGALAGTSSMDKAEVAAEASQTAAQAAPNPASQAEALIALLKILVEVSMPRRAAIVANAAARAADIVTDPRQKVRILVDLSRVLATTNMGKEAESSAKAAQTAARLSRNVERRAEAMAASAIALTAVGLREEAESAIEEAKAAAQTLTDVEAGRRSETLGAIVKVLARGGLHEQAEVIANSVNSPARQAEALAVVARAQAEAGLREKAVITAGPMEEIIKRIVDFSWRTHIQVLVIGELAHGGLHEQAEVIANSVNSPARQAEALAVVARAQAEAGLREKAVITAGASEIAARSAADDGRTAQDLSVVAVALAGAGQQEQATSAANASVRSAISVPDQGYRAEVLMAIVKDLAGAGLFEQAEAAAQSIDNKSRQSSALAIISNALAKVDLREEAVRIAQSIPSKSRQVHALSMITERFAENGRDEHAQQIADAAEEIAESINDRLRRSHALAELVAALIRAKLPQKANEIAEKIPDSARKAYVMARVTGALVDAGLHAQAEKAASATNRAAKAVTDSSQVPESMVSAAIALAHSGLYERAQKIADSIRSRPQQARALAAVSVAMAFAGLREDAISLARSISDNGRPVQAVHAFLGMAKSSVGLDSFMEAERVARSITNQEWQPGALIDVVRALADADLFTEAERVARSITNRAGQSGALGDVVRALAETGSFAEAGRVALSITDPSDQARAFVTVASHAARTGQMARAQYAIAVAFTVGT